MEAQSAGGMYRPRFRLTARRESPKRGRESLIAERRMASGGSAANLTPARAPTLAGDAPLSNRLPTLSGPYPAGWYVAALYPLDPRAARDLFVDYLVALERGWNDEAVDCAHECINAAAGFRKNAGYLTTAALPYAALYEAGLLPTEPAPGR